MFNGDGFDEIYMHGHGRTVARIQAEAAICFGANLDTIVYQIGKFVVMENMYSQAIAQ
jgi:hypothetical protein